MKRTIKPFRDDVEKENIANIKQRLKRLKDEQEEKDFKAMRLLREELYKAIDNALYGLDTELNHADILEVIEEALGDAGIYI